MIAPPCARAWSVLCSAFEMFIGMPGEPMARSKRRRPCAIRAKGGDNVQMTAIPVMNSSLETMPDTRIDAWRQIGFSSKNCTQSFYACDILIPPHRFENGDLFGCRRRLNNAAPNTRQRRHWTPCAAHVHFEPAERLDRESSGFKPHKDRRAKFLIRKR